MTFHTPFRPNGRSIWLGKDLIRTNDWLYQLPSSAIDDIDSAVKGLGERSAYSATLTPADFPIDSIKDDLDHLKEELATGRGFIVIRGLPKGRYSNNQLGLIFRGFASHFGRDLTQSSLGDRLGDIRDVSDVIVDRNKRRGYQSGGFQTAHTDPSGMTDVVAMLSLTKALSGGESLIASAHTVHNMMLDDCPELLKVFYDGFILRRPDSDAEALGRPALIGRVPNFCFEHGWLNCDFQNGYMRRAVENGDAAMSPRESAALAVFTAISNHPDVMLKMMLEPGDFQFINNRTILHGRASFEDYEEREKRRHLYRLWLSVPQWPRMPKSQSTLLAEDMAHWDAFAAARQ